SSRAASILEEPELPGTRAFLAQAFQRVGENVPGAKGASNPMRSLLISAGYRYPSAVSIFYGVKCAAALLFAAVVGGGGALNAGDFFSSLLGAVCGGGFGFLLPDFILKRMIRARATRMRRAIPV